MCHERSSHGWISTSESVVLQDVAGSAIPLTLAARLAVTDWLGDVHHIGGAAAASHQLFKPYAAAAAALSELSRFEDDCPALQTLAEVAKVRLCGGDWPLAARTFTLQFAAKGAVSANCITVASAIAATLCEQRSMPQ